MKRILVIVFALGGLSACAQTNKSDLLTSQSWKLESSGMVGIGIHRHMPKGSVITFFQDGKWKSSSPWENVTEGTWSLENNDRTLRVHFSAQSERDFRIDKLTDKELRWETKKLAAFYVDTWVAPK